MSQPPEESHARNCDAKASATGKQAAATSPPFFPGSHLRNTLQASPGELAARCQALEKLFWLVARGVVFFSTYNEAAGDWDDGWHPAVNLNDTFCCACADADPVRLDEFDLLIGGCRRFGDDGVTAWAAQKRQAAPIPPRQTEACQAACRYLARRAAAAHKPGEPHD